MPLFEYVPGQHKAKPVRNGAIFLALVLAVLFMGYTKNIPFFNEGAQKVKAHVPNSANIFPGNEVRVNGVRVGKVSKVERDPSGEGALISMKIQDGDVTVKKDARASVYWRTMLGGNFYVELQPGSKSAPKMEDNGTIPLSRTTTQVELDQLLTTFNPSGRQALKTFFREFQKGFSEEGVGKAVERLGPAMQNVAPGMRAVRGLRPGADIPELTRSASRALGALAHNENELGGLINGANTTLAVTAARRQDIGSMLDQAPTTLDDTRGTLARVRTTLDELDPVADDLRPGVRRLPATIASARPAMRTLKSLIPDALPVLRDIDPAIRRVRTAASSGVPLMQELNPTLDRLTDKINPWLGQRNDTTELKNSWAIGPFFSGVGDSSGAFDANGYTQNFDTAPSPGDLLSSSVPCEKFLSGEAACKLLLSTLGRAMGAGVETGSNP
jgi:virulence factor Mce-like protein